MSVIELDCTETRTRTRRDLLLAAAEIIEEYGWCQHNYRGANGGYCAEGALFAAGADDIALTDETLEWLESQLNRRSLPHWNDHRGRTVDEVLDLLRTAAAVSL